jgi:anti-sigma B factor antagonist
MNEIKFIIPEFFAVEEATELRQNVMDMIRKGEKNFLLDFHKCTFIDSTGLGVLVSAFKKCIENQGSLKLCSVDNPNVLKIFTLTRLDKVFGL